MNEVAGSDSNNASEPASNSLLERLSLVVEGFDSSVDQLFNGLRSKSAANSLFHWASRLADHSMMWVAGAAFLWLAFDVSTAELARLLIVLIIDSILVNQLLKRIFRRPRPEPLASNVRTRRPKTNSFPSGHASSAAVASIMFFAVNPITAIVVLPTAATVAVSRVHNRVHYATDVLAGAFVGSVVGCLSLIAWPT